MADQDRSKVLLAAHMGKARTLLYSFLNTHGVSIPVLAKAMEDFTHTVFDLPGEAACKAGCHYCCHLRVGVSIPELLVIFNELQAQASDEDLAWFKSRINMAVEAGDTLTEAFWHKSRTSCPFLDDTGKCLIYIVRPFSCRAYHSNDMAVCKKGFDERREIQVPCFPLYRATTDMYSSVFIRVLKEKGYASYQVGFVKGMSLLFKDKTLVDKWLNKEDVFKATALKN